MDELVGYYGEKLVLLAQMLGLNTCWVAMTFSKRATKGKCEIRKGEKLVCVLALGYGTNQGITHKIKDIKDVCKDCLLYTSTLLFYYLELKHYLDILMIKDQMIKSNIIK